MSGNTLLVANPFTANGAVNEYDATNLALINANFITGLYAFNLLMSGNTLFVSDGGGTVGEYDDTTGALITGLNRPTGISLLGNDLFVANGAPNGNGSVGEYDAPREPRSTQTSSPG